MMLGELELYIDGKTVISVHGLTIKMSKDAKIKGMHFQTFFGGTSLSASL